MPHKKIMLPTWQQLTPDKNYKTVNDNRLNEQFTTIKGKK